MIGGYAYDVMNESNRDAISRVAEVSEMIDEEKSKESPDESIITKLLFEQMLRGICIRSRIQHII